MPGASMLDLSFIIWLVGNFWKLYSKIAGLGRAAITSK